MIMEGVRREAVNLDNPTSASVDDVAPSTNKESE